MKIKTLAMIVVSALSLSSTAALADTTTVNGGPCILKEKSLMRPVRWMPALSIKPFS